MCVPAPCCAGQARVHGHRGSASRGRAVSSSRSAPEEEVPTRVPPTDQTPVTEESPDFAPTAPRDLKRSAVGGAFWLSAGNVVRAFVKIAVLAVLGRLLHPDAFGLVAAAGVVIWLSTIFSSLGVGPAIIQLRQLERRHVDTGLTASLLFGALIAIGVAAGAPAIAALFRLPGLVPVLRVLSLAFPITALSVTAEGLLQRRLAFHRIAVAELLSYAVGYGAVGVALAVTGAGVWALVGAEMAKTIVKTAVFLHAVPEARRLRFDRGAFGELFHFGSRYTASGFSIYLSAQGDNFIVARFLGATALGFYSRAYELMLVPAQALGMLLDKVLFPTMARVQEDPARLRLAYRRGTALVALLVLPLSAVTIVLAPEMVRVLLGPGWPGVVAPLRILTLGMYFRVGYMVGQSVSNAAGAVGAAAWRNVLNAVLVVVGAFIGRQWGLGGVAMGVLVAMIVNFAVVFHLGRRITGLRLSEFVLVHMPALGLAAAGGLVAWGTAHLMRSTNAGAGAVLLAAGTIVGALVLLLLRVVPGLMLGRDGVWLMEMIVSGLPGGLQPVLRRAFLPRLKGSTAG